TGPPHRGQLTLTPIVITVRRTRRSRQASPAESPNPRVLAYPGVHRDPAGNTRVDRPRRAELDDRVHPVAGTPGDLGQARTLLAAQQYATARQRFGLQRPGARQVVDADDRQAGIPRPANEFLDRRVVADMLVPVGHHRATAVPLTPPDDVHLGGE